MSSFVDVVRPANHAAGRLFDGVAVVAGSFLIALLAQVEIPLGFPPVPLTLQMLGILLIGALLGSKRGAFSVLTYLSEGAMGLPVFAGGVGGISYFMSPSAGYLLGFVLTAFLVGYLLERGWKERYGLTLLALFLGCSVTLFLGALWLSLFVGMKNALYMGVYPFVMVDCIKVLVAAALIPSGWKLLHYFR